MNASMYVYTNMCIYSTYVHLVNPPPKTASKHDMSFSRFSIAVELCKENLSLLLLQKRAVKRKYQSML